MSLFPRFICILSIVICCGCATRQPINPSFPLSGRVAHAALKALRTYPRELPRPLIIAGGFHDLGIPASSLERRFRSFFPDSQIVAVSFEGCHTFEACRARLISAVNRRFPSASRTETVPVDVVAVSMGGLVSRYAAAPGHGMRLSIQRLFTIATPHRGSPLARLPTREQLQRDMRPGSAFLTALSQAPRHYELYCYVRLGDEFVPLESAAPPGEYPWWLPYQGLVPPHNISFRDERIIAEIATRLRGGDPYSAEPPARLETVSKAASG